ncbi:MAG: branched-chain amino acid ABC transporter permease [Nocardioides sp.]|nr:branched-chain amino acid ABC transporter permease [Nocardioides sp.]
MTISSRSGSPGPDAAEETTVIPVVPAQDGADETTTLPPIDVPVLEDEEFEPQADRDATFRPSRAGWAARSAVWLVLAWFVLAFPVNFLSPFTLGVSDVSAASEAAIFAIVGLSLNVLLGYAGQISLGHQAFVGIGAFTSAYVVVDLEMGFWFAVAVASGLGLVQAAILGAVSLRLTGLYFALVTLAFGNFAQQTVFAIPELTGGEGGKEAPRPAMFDSDYSYYFLCLGFLAVVLFLDWRLTRSKAGRALQALRENPRVASSYGINVKAYTLLAFAVSGLFAGLAGALMAHHDEVIVNQKFGFQLALLFVLMTVVGGLRSRSGVVIGSAFFALLHSGHLLSLLEPVTQTIFRFSLVDFITGTIGLPIEFVALVIGPILLLLTITMYPGGIGQQIAPIREWMLGRRFDRHAGKVTEVEVNDVRA